MWDSGQSIYDFLRMYVVSRLLVVCKFTSVVAFVQISDNSYIE